MFAISAHSGHNGSANTEVGLQVVVAEHLAAGESFVDHTRSSELFTEFVFHSRAVGTLSQDHHLNYLLQMVAP